MPPPEPETRTILLRLQDAAKPGTQDHLEKSLQAVPRVERVEIDPTARTARVEHRGADPEELLRALRVLGYSAVQE